MSLTPEAPFPEDEPPHADGSASGLALTQRVAGRSRRPPRLDPSLPVALDHVVDEVETTAEALAVLRGNSFAARRQRDLGLVTGRLADTLERALDLLLVRAAAETRGGAVTLRVGRYRTLRSDWLEAELAHTGRPIDGRELTALLKNLSAVASGRSLPPDHRFAGFSACQSLCVAQGGSLLIDGGTRGTKERYIVRLPALTPQAGSKPADTAAEQRR